MKPFFRQIQRQISRQLRQLQAWVDGWMPDSITRTSRSVTRHLHWTATQMWDVVPKLKPFSRYAKLVIYNPKGSEPIATLPLLRQKYWLGRDPHLCDFPIINPHVSATHLILEKNKQGHYEIQDKESTHGLYHRGHRVKRLKLQHRNQLTLGDPRMADVVKIIYLNPPPLALRLMRWGLGSVGGLLTLLILVLLSPLVPDVSRLPELNQKPTVVYATTGQELNNPLHFADQFQHLSAQRLADIPKVIKDAVLASEDSRFYWHPGLDPIGIVRAILNRHSGSQQGASTLTQQVARSLFPFVGQDYTIIRKLREALVSLKLELFQSKDFIFLAYLNNIYLGVNVYGFMDAAPVYFGKPLSQVNLSEAATLTAMVTGPNASAAALCNRQSKNHPLLKKDRDRILDRMAAQHRIDVILARDTKRIPIQPSPAFCRNYDVIQKAPYFTDYVLYRELPQLLATTADEGNFIVESTLNWAMQQEAEASFNRILNRYGVSKRITQGAMITLDAQTGAVLAMVGGANPSPQGLNRALDIQRQPGSTFKLFTYLAALLRGIQPDKSYSCAPITWSSFTYEGCSARANGARQLTMAEGLALSENPIAFRIAAEVGLSKVIQMAQSLGIKSPLQETPGTVLGQSEVSLLEMTRAYGMVANGGKALSVHTIAQIRDSNRCPQKSDPQNCPVIYQNQHPEAAQKQVLDPNLTATMTSLLQTAVAEGTGRAAYLQGVQVAGKTGTTNDDRDLWFIGYLPEQKLVTGVWLGNDDNSSTQPGAHRPAAELWADYMAKLIN